MADARGGHAAIRLAVAVAGTSARSLTKEKLRWTHSARDGARDGPRRGGSRARPAGRTHGPPRCRQRRRGARGDSCDASNRGDRDGEPRRSHHRHRQPGGPGARRPRWVSADAAASADAAVPAARADGRAAPARSRTGSAETPSAARDGAAPRASGVLRAATRDRIVVLVTHRAEDRRRPTPTSRGRRRILDPTPGGFSTRWPPVASTPSMMTSTRCRGGDRPESATPSCPVVRQPEHLSSSGRSSRWEGGAAQLIPTDSRPLGTPPLPPREPPVQSSR